MYDRVDRILCFKLWRFIIKQKIFNQRAILVTTFIIATFSHAPFTRVRSYPLIGGGGPLARGSRDRDPRLATYRPIATDSYCLFPPLLCVWQNMGRAADDDERIANELFF